MAVVVVLVLGQGHGGRGGWRQRWKRWGGLALVATVIVEAMEAVLVVDHRHGGGEGDGGRGGSGGEGWRW